MKLKTIAAAVCFTFAAGTYAQPAKGISDDAVKVGLVLDMSSLYADITGPGPVAAAQLAIEDFGGKVLGKPIHPRDCAALVNRFVMTCCKRTVSNAPCVKICT